MLSTTSAYPTVPASDIERAKKFYSEKLGLEPAEDTPGGAFYDLGANTRFLLFPSMGAASGDHTQMGFQTEDIDLEVKELKGRGVEFIEYDLPNFKTEDSIAKVPNGRAAWFKDSEGNMLGVFQIEG